MTMLVSTLFVGCADDTSLTASDMQAQALPGSAADAAAQSTSDADVVTDAGGGDAQADATLTPSDVSVAGPDAHPVTISQVRITGAGCPEGSAMATLAPDRRSFTVDFRDLALHIDEDMRSDRRYCAVVVDVRAPAGRSYALQAFQGLGTIDLGSNVTAELTRSVSFTGLPPAPGKTTVLTGPLTSELRISDTFTAAEQSVAPCDVGRSLFLELGFTLRNGTPRSKGSLKLSSLAGATFALRDCAR